MKDLENIFSADFECTTNPDDCRVWATGICCVKNNNFEFGNSIEFLYNHGKKHNKATYYFHNLKYDGNFIISDLFFRGYTHIQKYSEISDKTFMTTISDQGLFYKIKIFFTKYMYITILDSLKLLNMSVEKVASTFNLPIKKLEIDYEEERPRGHILTEKEIDYLKNDVEIMARALKLIFEMGFSKMTQGANALNELIEMIGKKRFEYYFPKLKLEVDSEIRQSYKGGFTWCNPKFQNEIIDGGIVLDVNSLYPHVMCSCKLPYREPKFFKGKYKKDKKYPLYIQMITCSFELKENYIPTIQVKRNPLFRSTEYLTSSKDKNGNDCEVTMCLTNIDLDLFLEHYNVYNLEYHSGYKFRCSDKIFKPYFEKWYKIKEKATVEKNGGLRSWSKIMQNAVYGKFATSPYFRSKIPYLDENGIVKYKLSEVEVKDAMYIPVATFTTSYAREITIRSAQKNYERILYCDTDSLHLKGYSIPYDLEISDTKLGAWKIESVFTKGKFIRQKSYIEKIVTKDGKHMKVTCAGMTSKLHNKVNFSNFKQGEVFENQLKFKVVKGGVVLVNSEFSIN